MYRASPDGYRYDKRLSVLAMSFIALHIYVLTGKYTGVKQSQQSSTITTMSDPKQGGDLFQMAKDGTSSKSY
jgi:cytochrome c-type biogenesis protein CcmH/NrfG